MFTPVFFIKKIIDMKSILWMLLLCPSLSFGQNYIDQKYDNQRYIVDALTSGCQNFDVTDSTIRVGNKIRKINFARTPA